MKPIRIKKDGVDYDFHPLPDMTEDIARQAASSMGEINDEVKIDMPLNASARSELIRTADRMFIKIIYDNKTKDALRFKREVEGKIGEYGVRANRVEFSEISVSKTAQKDGVVSVRVWLLDKLIHEILYKL